MNNIKTNYYRVLTATIMYDKTLTPIEILLYAEITGLLEASGKCFASNQYFAERFDRNETTISTILHKLEKKGYIIINVDRKNNNKRVILLSEPLLKNQNTSFEKSKEPLLKNQKSYIYNNRVLITESNNISSVLEKQDNSNDEFNLFWKEWQSVMHRKTEVKKKAEKEFNKIKDKEKLNLALKNLKADIENKKIEPKFVKHLERWLRDEVWKEYLQCSYISTTTIPNSVHFEKNPEAEYTLSQYRNNHISQLLEISKATKSKCINIYDNCYNTFVNNIASNIYKTEYKANTQEGLNLILQLNDDMTNTPTLKHLKENLNEIKQYIENIQNDFCVSKTIVEEIQQDFYAKLQKAKDTMIGDMASYLVNKECQRVLEYQKAKDSNYRELSNDKKNIIIDFLKNKSMLYIDCVYMDQNQYPKVDEIEKNILQKNNEIEKNKKFISNFTSNVLEMNEKALEDNLLNIYREIYINLKKHLTL